MAVGFNLKTFVYCNEMTEMNESTAHIADLFRGDLEKQSELNRPNLKIGTSSSHVARWLALATSVKRSDI